MSESPIEKINESEIINQKKQFIFEVEQTSNFVFPNEVFTYYIYIKNISGVQINHFKIQIENDPSVIFESDNKDSIELFLEPNETKLYEMKAYCSKKGKYLVHFIGYGEGTQILYQTLEINCNTTYNSDKLMHRLSIYDFTPYEDKYSMEATNFSNQVTQTFKRQQLPYKAKKQPFNLETNFVPENKESESFIQQYNIAKNTEGHCYQYISRESFIEDAIESYTGENLLEIFKKINKNSDYFRGKFIKTGTNHLLNTINQYKPNGFIYRMGLLNSEIYHTLGVIPTYTYMSDRLFRWAPEKNQFLDLTPQKKAMKWGENIWAGRGWIVYQEVTDEYKKTDEYKEEKEKHLIENRKIINSFERKDTAKEFISKMERLEDRIRDKQKTDIIKYKYSMYESLYDNGVFFVNIPISKVPTNFILPTYEDLEALINRTKPYGTKPIINYVIEHTFSQHMDISVIPNYHKKFLFDMNAEVFNSRIDLKEYLPTIFCQDNEARHPYKTTTKLVQNIIQSQDIDMIIDNPLININNIMDFDVEEEVQGCETEKEYQLNNIEDVLEVLYQNNYNSIAFKIKQKGYTLLRIDKNKEMLFSEIEEGLKTYTTLQDKKVEALKLEIQKNNKYKNDGAETILQIKDIYNKKHEICIKFDKDLQEDCISYIYTNTNNKKDIRKKGYGKIQSINLIIEKLYNKKILLFMVQDSNKEYFHYFHHVIVEDIYSLEVNRKTNNQIEDLCDKLYYTNNVLQNNIIFETPFIKEAISYQPKITKNESEWENIYRLNDSTNSYAYIVNKTNDYLPIKNIFLYYDQINIPETSIVKKLRFKLNGLSSPSNNVYISNSFNINYLIKELSGYNLQLSPNKIECYNQANESSIYYQNKLEIAKNKEQKTLIDKFNRLLEENYIFNDDIDFDVLDYLNSPNDFITINKEYWCELSEFSDLDYKLNEIDSINLIIEGYNTEYESNISIQTLSETQHSSTVKKKIPSGYFRERISLPYPNEFLLEVLRVRFKFEQLIHDIKIFDTKIELKFSRKQNEEISFKDTSYIKLDSNEYITLLEDYYLPANLNNGIAIQLEFDDLKPGEFYHLNSTELEVIYEDTEINMMVNNKRYQDVFYDANKSLISGKINDAYISGEFYNDVLTTSQEDENTNGIENKGIKLQDSLYQLFENHNENITSIEIFPYGFHGNPDETLKIGLYTNSHNTPGKLLKEIYVNGWVKNNPELRGLKSIKYNFNIDNLKINEKYWFKIQVLNPQENSYYLLMGINNTKAQFKLLADENNNYINTFSNLKFNIYSKNLTKSFNNVPVLQDYLNNPYIMIGLHKGQGSIEKLQANKYIKCVSGNDYMSEVFKEELELKVFKIIEKVNTEERELPTEDE